MDDCVNREGTKIAHVTLCEQAEVSEPPRWVGTATGARARPQCCATCMRGTRQKSRVEHQPSVSAHFLPTYFYNLHLKYPPTCLPT